jgi:autoinducer 2 (AI-2) kinase
VGVGVVEPKQAAVFGGSFWQYEFNTANGKTDPGCRVRVNCHAVPDVWQYEALAFKPGLVMRWFRDGFCQLEKQQGEASGKDPYYLMDQKAKDIPAGSYGMLCAFSDVMNFISWKHASPTFTNFELDPQKFNRYTFYRAILENTAMVTKGHLDLVKEATGNMPSEIVFAGGAAKSPLWCQIVADILGLPVKVPVVKEATALGAAILAGYGVGLYQSIPETAKKLVKWDKVYMPDAKNHAVYQKMYAPWRAVYAAQLSLCDQKYTKNMWIAPGV